ncbi:MAG TPA: FecR domain-containing protein, partial [Blastocatellia bacterium]|nr:FecR domain-containing protein [Blastocatellia bacterium]
ILHRDRSSPPRALLIAFRLITAIVACWWAEASLSAQTQIAQARIMRVTGPVVLFSRAGSSLGPTILKRGDLLQPGDIIETGSGSLVIAMNDGSQVLVYPNSRLVLKDFRRLTSWRDLLEVAFGRIRAKINHYGKRPNPYRVYSPIAAIAVRGTDFLVGVDQNAETQVFVYEGLVEVSSLLNSQQKVLVRPGRNVIIRSNGDIGLMRSGTPNLLDAVNGRSVSRDFLIGFEDPSADLNLFNQLSAWQLSSLMGSPFNNPSAPFNTFQRQVLTVTLNGQTQSLFLEGPTTGLGLFNPSQSLLTQPGRYLIPGLNGEVSTITVGANLDPGLIDLPLVPGIGFQKIGEARIDPTVYAQLSPSRFISFADSHYDSLQNPAYAAEFTRADGRFYWASALSRPPRYTVEDSGSRARPGSFDQTLSLQSSYFEPIGKSGLVLGGDVALLRSHLGDGARRNPPPVEGYPAGTVFDGDNTFSTLALAFMVARPIGSGKRTSLGGKFDFLLDHSLRSTQIRAPGESRSLEFRGADRGQESRIGFSIGVTRDIAEDQKLGVSYRYSAGSFWVKQGATLSGLELGTGDSLSLIDNLSKVDGTARGSEISAMFRGSRSQRLFYGVEGSLLFLRSESRPVSGVEGPRALRTMLGGGIGYALRPRTVFSLDLSAGVSRYHSPIYLFPPDHGHFLSMHLGAQTDVWRRFFANTSLQLIRSRDLFDRPDRPAAYAPSNFGLGWRVKSDWLVQYTYFTDFGRSIPYHTLTLRHNFGRRASREE